MGYQHKYLDGMPLDLPVGKVVCVGRNYVDHIQELDNEIPSEPLLFIKPSTSLCDVAQPLSLPTGLGECHNELEIAVLIGNKACCVDTADATKSIAGIGLGLDLTLRDLQSKLKKQGLPWERAKAFDNACPMSQFVQFQSSTNLHDLEFELTINGEPRQLGRSKLMIWHIETLIAQISQVFTLLPGDVVMTGTPKGVGPLQRGDALNIKLKNHFEVSTCVA